MHSCFFFIKLKLFLFIDKEFTPCLNGGTLISMSMISSYACFCPYGYTEADCGAGK
jgi:hypothetical protein